MDMPEVKSFNAELSGLYDNKPPISKAKMSAITRGAIKAIKFYKHVVHSVEKFIQKCKPEYKVPGLYVIDSIVRQSRHQFGQDKDVFAPRFAKNMQQTFANLFRCPPDDKRNIIRVLNLWQKNNVFSQQVIQPLMDMANPNHPLHQEIQQQQQNNTANGSSLNLSHNTSDNKMSPMASQHSPHTSSPMGDQFQDEPSGQPGVKFNRKLLNDFEYESEDEQMAPEPTAMHSAHTSHTSHSAHQQPHQQQNPTDALGSILTNPEIMRQLQSLQAQMQLMTGMQMPNFMPMMSDMQLQQNQNQNLPFMNSQQDQHKQGEQKDDMANESDIEFVETGPQVIEIPDVNDSRSPSPKSRRHRSRSRSRSKSAGRRRRRGSRSPARSRSPKRRRERDRERDKDRDRDKDREKNYKEREADREKQREREKKGLPPIKKENLSVCSTTLWVGHLSKLATPEELSDLFGCVGGVVSIDVVAPRGCAFVVMERRRDAHKACTKLNKHKLHSKEITVAWAPGKGVKGREWKDFWEAELGVSYLPWAALQARWAMGVLSLDALEDGGAVDEDTLPPWLPPRIMPKSMMENMSMMGMPPSSGSGPGMMGNLPPGMPSLPPNLPNLPPNLPNMPNLPPNLPNLPPGNPLQGGNLQLPANLANVPTSMAMGVPRMPPPGMPSGLPPGLAAGLPPGIRPPSMPNMPNMPAGVPGLQTDTGMPPASQLMRFPPGLPPQSIGQPGMVGGFLGGLLGVGVGVGGLVGVGSMPLLHPHLPHSTPPPRLPQPQPQPHSQQLQQPQHQQPQRSGEMSNSDDAMDLDPEDTHTEETNGDGNGNGDTQTDTHSTAAPPQLLSDQLQALLSKPPPSFNSSEPPPGFNMSEPPPFNASQTDDKNDDDRKNDRDRDRRDRDRDRDRDRRDRDRGRDGRRDRDRGRDRDREDRRDRDRDRGGDRGRERRDRDRDRGERGDRERFSSRDNNRERSREKSPRTATNPDNPEKSLQERLWEMANGKPASQSAEKPRDEFQESREREDTRDDRDSRDSRDGRMERPPLIDRLPMRHDGPPMMNDVAEASSGGEGEGGGAAGGGGGWKQLAPPRLPPPHMAPAFRAELRMRGPPRQPMAGPWMDGPGPGPGPFGPRFNGMGPPPFNRPPFERPPFEGGPLFEGPPRFERPPFNRMPFDGMNRPPFDGPRPPFDGPRPPFDGPRPPFDGPRPPFDGPRPPFDGPRPPFDGPRPPFDGPRPFDGPPFDGDRPPFDGPPRFDGPPEFFDRNNRRFDDREQFNDRGWNGDRDREWDRRNEWDDRRRDRRPREHDDRFRDRNDRRRNFDDGPPRNRPPRDTPGRDGARDGSRDGPRDGHREGSRDGQREGSRDGQREGSRDGQREGSRDGQREGSRDRQREGPRDGAREGSRDRTREAPKESAKDGARDAPRESVREERNSRRDKDRKSRWGAAEESEQIEQEKPQDVSEVSTNIISTDDVNLETVNTGDKTESSHDEQNVQTTAIEISNIVEENVAIPHHVAIPEPVENDVSESTANEQEAMESTEREKQVDEENYSAPLETHVEPEQPAVPEETKDYPANDLYDSSDAVVDTSFSIPAPEIEPFIENNREVEATDEAPAKSNDIFSEDRKEPEPEAEIEATESRTSVDSKEGAA